MTNGASVERVRARLISQVSTAELGGNADGSQAKRHLLVGLDYQAIRNVGTTRVNPVSKPQLGFEVVHGQPGLGFSRGGDPAFLLRTAGTLCPPHANASVTLHDGDAISSCIVVDIPPKGQPYAILFAAGDASTSNPNFVLWYDPRLDPSDPPHATITTDVPSAAEQAATADCSANMLRSGQSSNGQPLLRRDDGSNTFFYDTLTVHACRDGYALFEVSHSGGSSFDYWAAKWDRGAWVLLANGSVRLDTPTDVPIFADGQLDAGFDDGGAAYLTAIGRTTKFGRPLVR